MMKYQINRHYWHCQDGKITYNIVEFSESGYKGRTYGTTYQDGQDYSDWCVFVGTFEECVVEVERCEQMEKGVN